MNVIAALVALAVGGCSLGGDDTEDGGDKPPKPRGPVVAVIIDASGERRTPIQADGAIENATADGRGGWYVSGQFRNIGGYDRGYLARIGADGKVNPDWKPRIDRNETTVTVSARLAVGAGRVYLAGDFGSANGVPRKGGAALHTETGKLDPTWAPNLGTVSDAMVFAGDRVIVATGTYVEAYDPASGRRDPAFRLRSAPGGDNDAGVDALVPSGSQLYVAGVFTRLNGEPRTGVARVDPRTGKVDERWRPPKIQTGGYGSVYEVAVTPENVFVVGEFARVGSRRTRDGLAALDAESAAPSRSFKPPRPGRSADGFRGFYETIAPLGTRVLVGGDFGGAPTHSFVALDGRTGKPVRSWHPRKRGALIQRLVPSGSGVLVTGTNLGD